MYRWLNGTNISFSTKHEPLTDLFLVLLTAFRRQPLDMILINSAESCE